MLQKHEIKTLRDAQDILARSLFTENKMFRHFLYGELGHRLFEMTPLEIVIAFFDAFPEFEEDHQPVYVTVTEVDGSLYFGNYPTDQLRIVHEYHFAVNVFHKYARTGIPMLYWNIVDEENTGLTGRLIYDASTHRLHAIGCCVDKIQGYTGLLSVIVETAYKYLETYPDLIKLYKHFQQVN
jgi:hypothetical protein